MRVSRAVPVPALTGTSFCFAAATAATRNRGGGQELELGIDGAARQAKELGVAVVYKEKYSSGTKDLSPELEKMKAARPDMIIAGGYTNDMILLARQITGQDSALGQLRAQIAELTQLLALEKAAKADADASLAALQDDFAAEKSKNASLSALLQGEGVKGDAASQTISGLQTSLDKEKTISSQALAQVELLNQQIAAMRRQLQTLNALLAEGEIDALIDVTLRPAAFSARTADSRPGPGPFTRTSTLRTPYS